MTYRAYVICTSPRSGSTLLCSMLAATGVAGKPDSYFHRPSLRAWARSLGLDDAGAVPESGCRQSVFSAAQSRGRGQTGIFGLRLQGGSLGYFAEQLRLLHPQVEGAAARIRAEFGPTLFIHLTRGEKLDQAISLLRAEQSGLWHRHADGTERERLTPHREPEYDRQAIARHMRELGALEAGWQRWFAAEGVRPLRLTYDMLAADPAATTGLVLALLGLDPKHARGLSPPVARLSDGTNRDWADRYRAGNP